MRHTSDLASTAIVFQLDRGSDTLFVGLYDAETFDFKAIIEVHDFQIGDLGLSFIEEPTPLNEYLFGAGSDAVIQTSWDDYNGAMTSLLDQHVNSALAAPAAPQFEMLV